MQLVSQLLFDHVLNWLWAGVCVYKAGQGVDKGVAYLQSGGKSSNTSPPTDVCPHQVSCGAAAAQMATLSNSPTQVVHRSSKAP